MRKREKVDELLLGRIRKLLRDMSGVEGGVPEDEDGVFQCARDCMAYIADRCDGLLKNEYVRASYPGRSVVETGLRLAHEVSEGAHDARALFGVLKQREGDFLDFSEDFEQVQAFFPNQQRLFDEALKASELMKDEAVYFEGDEHALQVLANLRSILADERPYRRIKDLSGFIGTIE